MNHDTISSNAINSDLLSCAMHYDETTILHNNGYLSRTIEFYFDKDSQIDSLYISHFLHEIIDDYPEHKNFFFHTSFLRRKTQNHHFAGNQNNLPFQELFTKSWLKINQFQKDKIFVNRLFLTIIIKNDALYSHTLSSSLFFVVKHKFQKINKILYKRLDKFVRIIVKKLEDQINNFNIKIRTLSLQKIDNQYYSENLNYFYDLLYAGHFPYESLEKDFSNILLNNTYVSDNENFLEIYNQLRNVNKFIAIFAFKTEVSLSEEAVNILMYLPIVYNITQTFHRSESIDFNKMVNLQLDVLSNNHETQFIEKLHINTNAQNKNLFEQITFLTIIANSEEELDDSITVLKNVCHEIGVLLNRLDWRLEELFFAQIPGNSSFINYRNYFDNNYGNFLYLNDNYYIKKAYNKNDIEDVYGSLLISATDRQEFYFNIIDVDYINNFIGGEYAHYIANFFTIFLINSNAFVINIDCNQSSRLLFNVLGCKYLRIEEGAQNRKTRNGLNLLSIKKNKKALTDIIKFMLAVNKQDNRDHINDEQIQALIDEIMLNDKIKHLKDCQSIFKKYNIDMNIWLGDGLYNSVFDNDKVISLNQSLGIDISKISNEKVLGVLLNFIIYEMMSIDSNQPKVIIINDFVKLYKAANLEKEDFMQLISNLSKVNTYLIAVDKEYSLLKDNAMHSKVKFDRYLLTQGALVNDFIESLGCFDSNNQLNNIIKENFLKDEEFNDMFININSSLHNKDSILKVNFHKIQEANFLTRNDQYAINNFRKLKKIYNNDLLHMISEFYKLINVN